MGTEKSEIEDEKESKAMSSEKIKVPANEEKGALELEVSEPKVENKHQDSTVDEKAETQEKEELGVF